MKIISKNYFFFRSEKKTLKKIIKLDVEISDFFELNYFQSNEKENNEFQLNLKFRKVLMRGEVGEEIAGLCKNGGKI